jgi:hypothetical protein
MDTTASLVVAADRKNSVSGRNLTVIQKKSIITILIWISKPLFRL